MLSQLLSRLARALSRTVEVYEQRLQDSFEEREAACAALLERERELRRQMASQHAQRRQQLVGNAHLHGRWMELLWRANPVWQARAPMTEELAALETQQRACEDSMSNVGRYTTLVLDTLREAASLLVSTSVGAERAAADLRAELAGSVDLSATIDLSSAEGSRALGSLSTHEASTLHVARQLVLRLCSLRSQLEKAEGCRAACLAQHEKLQATLTKLRTQLDARGGADSPARRAKSPRGGAASAYPAPAAFPASAAAPAAAPTAALSEDDLAEALDDLASISAASTRRVAQMAPRTYARNERSRDRAEVLECLREVAKALGGALRLESEQLRAAPDGWGESERRRAQRQARREEAACAATELEDEVQLSLYADDDDDGDGEDGVDSEEAAALKSMREWKAATISTSLAPYLVPDAPAAAAAAAGGGAEQMVARKVGGDGGAGSDGGDGGGEMALLERLLGGLKVLERCAGHRMLHREQGRGKDVGASCDAAVGKPMVVVGRSQPSTPSCGGGAVAGGSGPPSPSKASNVALLCNLAELKEELELARKSNAQLLSVVSCQAASIEQITSGRGDASAREAQQQAALAEQARQLAAMNAQLAAMKEQGRRQHEALSKELVAKGEGAAEEFAEGGACAGLGGAAAATAAATAAAAALSTPKGLTADTMSKELKLQLKQQAELAEATQREYAAELARLGEQSAKMQGRLASLEKEVAVSREVRETMQQHIDEQATELQQARAVEEAFGALAAKLGCVDEEGQLMRQRLETLTMELVEARASESQYQEVRSCHAGRAPPPQPNLAPPEPASEAPARSQLSPLSRRLTATAPQPPPLSCHPATAAPQPHPRSLLPAHR